MRNDLPVKVDLSRDAIGIWSQDLNPRLKWAVKDMTDAEGAWVPDERHKLTQDLITVGSAFDSVFLERQTARRASLDDLRLILGYMSTPRRFMVFTDVANNGDQGGVQAIIRLVDPATPGSTPQIEACRSILLNSLIELHRQKLMEAMFSISAISVLNDHLAKV